ncbi:MAG TPA: hypothetical protein VGF30_03680 [Bacteroidia bacterium]
MKNRPVEEIVKPSGKGEITTIFSFVLSVLLVLNVALYYYFEKFDPRDWKFLAHIKWGILKNLNGPADWLITGDSSGNQGIETSPFKEELGETAYNLCTIGPMLTLDDSWMLEYHINKYGPPKNVLMIHVYDLWNRKADHEVLSENPVTTIFKDGLGPDLGWSYSQKAKMLSYRLFPIYSKHHGLKMLLSGEAKWFVPAAEVDSSGFNKRILPKPDNVIKDTEGHIKFVKDSAFALSDECRMGLKHIKALVDKHNIELYITMSPLHDSLYFNPYFQKYKNSIDSMLYDFAQNDKHIHLINNPPMVFKAEEMDNSDHVVGKASHTFTLHLINEIKKIRAAK